MKNKNLNRYAFVALVCFSLGAFLYINTDAHLNGFHGVTRQPSAVESNVKETVDQENEEPRQLPLPDTRLVNKALKLIQHFTFKVI